jgi:CHAT domain-containing protein
MGTFRSSVGPLYYELADLLLTRADHPDIDKAQVGEYLSSARDTVERLRVGELESYFQDPCVNLAREAQTNLSKNLSKIQRGNPAIVYVIPLQDRIETLVTTRTGTQRKKLTAVGAKLLNSQVRAFRKQVEGRTYGYVDYAQRLYNWLIRPIEALLEEEKIDTLIFVPDGALRTVPMTALMDGDQYLVERYAVGVSPGLSLRLSETEADQVSPARARVLASGLSITPPTNRDLKPLPNVRQELASIEQIYKDSSVKRLLDEQFKIYQFSRALKPSWNSYSIVHIASHGEFAADMAKTFVLAYDGKLKLDGPNGLESLLRPHQLQGKPLYLLTLSACETLAGDDEAALERASLGLGGLAVKAGARSAMASLWSVDDDATRELMTRFYDELHRDPQAGKANALQQAQRSLIADQYFSHPRFWAPFLMIGDWL